MEIQNNENKTPLIAGYYARVSTGRQEQEATIESQKEEIEARIKADGNTLFQENIFIDDGWTGELLQRPELDRLRDALVEGKIEILYVYDRGRLSRIFAHQEVVIEEIIDHEIQFVTIHDVSADTPEGKLMQSVMGIFHEYERMKILERFRRGKLFKSRHGLMINGSSVYGYNYISKTETEPTHYEINEEQARIVNMIFDWVGNRGYSIREVIRQLYKLEIPPRKGKSDFWTKGPVVRLLRRDTYSKGVAYYQKSEAIVAKHPYNHDKYKKVKRTSRRERPREDWIPLQVPIILQDNDLYERVQVILNNNQRNAPKNRKYNYLLTGKAFCECGQRRVGDGYSKGQNHYYRCAERIYKFPLDHKCHSQGVNAVVLDQFLWTELKKFLSDPELLKQQAEEWLKNESKNCSKTEIDTISLQKQIEKIKEEEIRYSKIYGSGSIEFDQFELLMRDLNKKKHSCETQITELNQPSNNYSVDLTKVDELCEETIKTLENIDIDDKKRVIQDIIDHVVIYDKGVIEVNGHIPLFTQKVGYETINRNCWLAKRW